MVTVAQLEERKRLIEANNVPVLDSGYVRMVEPWGSDERISGIRSYAAAVYDSLPPEPWNSLVRSYMTMTTERPGIVELEDFTGRTFKLGLYEHYKGGRYRALQIVSHHETGEMFVVYISLTHGVLRIREYATPGKDSWTDVVNGTTDIPVPRFRWLER